MRYLEDGTDEVMSFSPDEEEQRRRLMAGGNEDDWQQDRAIENTPGIMYDRWGAPPPINPQGPVEMAPAIQRTPASEPAPILNPGYTSKLDQLEQVVGERPTPNRLDDNGKPIQPKWWQKALAAGFGGLAGWTNAAGRTRQPIDIQAGGEAILHPTYKTRLQDWTAKVQPIEQQAQIEGQKQGAWWKGQEAQAQAEQQQAHAEYWRHRAQMETNRFKINAKGQVVDTYTGQVKGGAPSLQDRYEEGKAIGMDEDQARVYAANPTAVGRERADARPVIVPPGSAVLGPDNKPIYTNPKSAREVDPLIEERRRQILDETKQKGLESVGKTKLDEEAKALNDHRGELGQILQRAQMTDLATAMANPNTAKEITALRDKTRQKLQNINDQFVSSARGRGVNADDFEVQPDFSYKPRTAGQPAGGRGNTTPPLPAGKFKFTREQVRTRASARGLDPNIAEAGAREKGLIQ